MPSTEKIVELSNTLGRIIAILEWDDEQHWCKVIAKVKYNLDASKTSNAIDALLGIYGGMGSFNDLVIGQSMENGMFSWKDGAKEKNEELNQLRSVAYQLAIALREKNSMETA